MPKESSSTKPQPMAMRMVVFSTIVLAIGLAGVGNILAFDQVRSATTRLITAASLRAGQVATQANTQFPERLGSALRTVADHVRRQPATTWDPPPRFPTWIAALYAWNGEQLDVVFGSPVDDLGVTKIVRGLVSTGPIGLAAVAFSPHPQIDFAHVGNREIIVAQAPATGAELRPIVIAGVLEPVRIQTEFLAPLVSGDEAIEVTLAEKVSTDGGHNLSGALRGWAIRPAVSFVENQRRTVLTQTLAYVGLTTVALGALLIAMWFLMRVVRREMALAELKSGFVADVSHELKTPLALIRMYAETLQDGRIPTEEKKQEYYEVILRESGRLTDLINNILDFSRIEAGRKEYHLEPTDVAAVVEQTYDAYKPQLEHAGFQHELRTTRHLPRVDADRGAIAQILVNLITNAVKYSDEEKYVLIELTTDTRRNRRGVLISVQDRGIGITPEDRAMLTEGFYRAADQRVRQKAGAGLGLAVVRHIVDAHGGSLDVESRLVKGSTFRVFLPAAPEPNAEEQSDGENTDR